jgi:hypothetical protein
MVNKEEGTHPYTYIHTHTHVYTYIYVPPLHPPPLPSVNGDVPESSPMPIFSSIFFSTSTVPSCAMLIPDESSATCFTLASLGSLGSSEA